MSINDELITDQALIRELDRDLIHMYLSTDIETTISNCYSQEQLDSIDID